jgi:hypothetical protein
MDLVRADLGHLWAHLDLKMCAVTERQYSLLVGEVMRGRAYAGLVDDRPLGLGGVYDAGDGGSGFPWLSVAPGGLGRHLVVAVRHMRRVIAADARRYPSVACSVADDNARGMRLAVALGFVPTDATIGGIRRWDLEE